MLTISDSSLPFLLISDFDECRSSPCQNGGTCFHGVGLDLFICTCAQGWQGSLCQMGKLKILSNYPLFYYIHKYQDEIIIFIIN